VVLAVLGDRIETVAFGGATLTLRQLAQETFALATEASEGGDEEAAERLRRVGQELQRLASQYRAIRALMPGGPERTRLLELLVAETRELAAEATLRAEDVRRWYDEGTEEARITALALMEGDQRLRDLGTAIDAIGSSRSAFEQYHGLVLADAMVRSGTLTAVEQALLTIAVERSLRSRRLQSDADRRILGGQILDELRRPKRGP
jgi:hypothetical protein